MNKVGLGRATGGVLLLGMLVACGDGLVGSRCAAGFVQDGESCVPDPSAGGASSGAGGSAADGGAGSGAATTGGGGEGGAGGDGNNGNAGSGNGGGCTPPLVGCGVECVDLTSDPNHCGACFNACPTGICQDSTCVGSVAGHVVVVGMDFQETSAATSTMLGNAVFMAKHEPVRVLTYRQYAHPTAATSVQANLSYQAAVRNRGLDIIVAGSAANVPLALDSEDADVLFVHDQRNAPSGFLATAGASWADSIATFTAKGGVVVVLASSQGTAEMPDLLDEAGLLDVNQATDVTGQNVVNVGWLDAVGQGVLSPLKTKKASCAFQTSEAPSDLLSYVIVTNDDRPVVVHKVVVAGP